MKLGRKLSYGVLEYSNSAMHNCWCEHIHGCMHPALLMVIFFLPSFSMLLLLTWVQFCAKCDFTEWLSLRLKQYPASLGQHG